MILQPMLKGIIPKHIVGGQTSAVPCSVIDGKLQLKHAKGNNSKEDSKNVSRCGGYVGRIVYLTVLCYNISRASIWF